MVGTCLVRDKYEEMYNRLHLKIVTQLSTRGLDISLKIIDQSVINDWKTQWQNVCIQRHKHGGWDWEKIYTEVYRPKCKRLDLAIYKDGQLEGLVLGRISSGRWVIRIDYLEGSPLAKPQLKGNIITIATMFATYVGYSVDAKHIAIVNPVNEKVEDLYKKQGFEYERPYGNYIKNTMYKALT